MGGGEDEAVQPLFATKQLKGRVAYRCFASTIFVGICLILVYRLKYIPSAEEHGRWAWIGLFMAELWFGFYWIITQSVRWNVIHRVPFKDRLLQRSFSASSPSSASLSFAVCSIVRFIIIHVVLGMGRSYQGWTSLCARRIQP